MPCSRTAPPTVSTRRSTGDDASGLSTTVAPAWRASCTAIEPTAPLAPVTATRSPGRRTPTSCNATHAEVDGEKNAEPQAIDTPSGNSPRASSGASMSSHQVPSVRVPRPPPRSHTRVPAAKRPEWTTVPAASTPGV